MTTKPAAKINVVHFNQHEIMRRLSFDRSGGTMFKEKSGSMSKPDHIDIGVNLWHARLRNFRSGDWYDALTLISTVHGRHIMSKSIDRYLQEWVQSDWVDGPEIEMLAIDLARLWPRKANPPELVPIPGSAGAEIGGLFITAFLAHRDDDGPRLDEEFVDPDTKQAMA